jgi:hypothetical protein
VGFSFGLLARQFVINVHGKLADRFVDAVAAPAGNFAKKSIEERSNLGTRAIQGSYGA